jgi:diguanylate cyclase (GGDEF)-like protein
MHSLAPEVLVRAPGKAARQTTNVIELARFDRTTRLQDRAAFVAALDELLVADTNGTCPALLVFNIDPFPEAAGDGGPASGESLLRTIGEVLVEMIARRTVLACLAPGAFALFLPGNQKEHTAFAFARRLARRFAEGFHVGEKDFALTLSIGLAFFPADGADAESMIRNAGSARHAAKNLGGNLIRRHER